jgi:hypothetical protein
LALKLFLAVKVALVHHQRQKWPICVQNEALPNASADKWDIRLEGYFESRNLVLYLNRLSMKKFFTILAAFMPLTTLIAQTFLNQEFGTTAESVTEFLKTKQMVHANVLDENTIVASTETYTVTYRFDDGGLYKVETLSDFPNKGEAIKKVVDFKAQYLQEMAEILDLSSAQEMARFAALKGRELHEVSTFDLGKNGAQIRIVAIDLDRAPGVAMNELRQDNALFAMTHR